MSGLTGGEPELEVGLELRVHLHQSSEFSEAGFDEGGENFVKWDGRCRFGDRRLVVDMHEQAGVDGEIPSIGEVEGRPQSLSICFEHAFDPAHCFENLPARSLRGHRPHFVEEGTECLLEGGVLRNVFHDKNLEQCLHG